VLPAPGVVVRPARPQDEAAELVFAAAARAYSSAAGSQERARAIVAELWPQPGHSASFEHALVAELDGRLAGVMIGFPARDRYRLHRSLLVRALPRVDARRRLWLAVALPALILATPRPPRDAYYVGTIGVAWHSRRRGVGSTLGYHAERVAAERGFRVVVAHTGSRHLPARRALERYGLHAIKERSRSYVLYAKRVTPTA
jgi:ribosomal protein S18 acetylase RimI-like enzyme